MKRWLRMLGLPAGIAAAIGIAAALGVHAWLAASAEYESDRAQYLKREIAKLDRDIAEISALRDQIHALLARSQVVETLHAVRLEPVRLLDHLARGRPEGVTLRTVKQQGARVNLVGSAPSYASVWRFIKNLESTPLLERPELVEVKAADASKIEFDLNIHLRRPRGG